MSKAVRHFVTQLGFMMIAACGAPWASLHGYNTTMRKEEVTCQRCQKALSQDKEQSISLGPGMAAYLGNG